MPSLETFTHGFGVTVSVLVLGGLAAVGALLLATGEVSLGAILVAGAVVMTPMDYLRIKRQREQFPD